MTNSQIENSIVTFPAAKRSVVLLMVCVYVFLVIERPWESIQFLHGIPIERIYAIVMIIIAVIAGKFKIVSSLTNKWVYGLLLLHFMLAPFAFNPSYAFDQGIEYAKMVVLYLLMLAVADDKESLKLLVKVYVFSTMFYMLHSLWEYHNGRHTWRMGITRMIGVDNTYNDPNSFGASLVLSLPFVYALLRSSISNQFRMIYYVYFALTVVCIVLTGSRSSFLAMIFLVLIWVFFQGDKRIKRLVLCAVILGMTWLCMPSEKQDRIRSLWDKDAGTVGAHMSAEGRMIGWQVSWKMFKLRPLTGVGAGGKNFIGYRMTNKIDEEGQESPLESHVLYGEIIAELGIAGALLFLGFVCSVLKLSSRARNYLQNMGLSDTFIYRLSGAVIVSMSLLLFLGLAGHNFYRPLWLWLAAWAGASCLVARESGDKCSTAT